MQIHLLLLGLHRATPGVFSHLCAQESLLVLLGRRAGCMRGKHRTLYYLLPQLSPRRVYSLRMSDMFANYDEVTFCLDFIHFRKNKSMALKVLQKTSLHATYLLQMYYVNLTLLFISHRKL